MTNPIPAEPRNDAYAREHSPVKREGLPDDERKAIDDAVAEFLGATFTDAVTDALVDHIVRALEAARSAP